MKNYWLAGKWLWVSTLAIYAAIVVLGAAADGLTPLVAYHGLVATVLVLLTVVAFYPKNSIR